MCWHMFNTDLVDTFVAWSPSMWCYKLNYTSAIHLETISTPGCPKLGTLILLGYSPSTRVVLGPGSDFFLTGYPGNFLKRVLGYYPGRVLAEYSQSIWNQNVCKKILKHHLIFILSWFSLTHSINHVNSKFLRPSDALCAVNFFHNPVSWVLIQVLDEYSGTTRVLAEYSDKTNYSRVLGYYPGSENPLNRVLVRGLLSDKLHHVIFTPTNTFFAASD